MARLHDSILSLCSSRGTLKALFIVIVQFLTAFFPEKFTFSTVRCFVDDFREMRLKCGLLDCEATGSSS